MRTLIAAILCASATACCCAVEEATPTPAAATAAVSYADIDVADLAKLVAAKQVVLLDVNGSDSYKSGHIPGAIDFTAHRDDIASLLPADKQALIVAYCGGPQCPMWKHGADAVAKLGYTNVRHLKAGISGWKDAKEPTEN